MDQNTNFPGGQQYQAPIYQQQPYPAQPPAQKLKTDRNIALVILFSILTLGIYSIVLWCQIANEINLTASRADGKKTTHYIVCLLLSCITFGIYAIVWMHKISDRIGAEAVRRNTGVSFGAADFWIWNVLLAFTVVCPFIYMHKMLEAVNAINTSYNIYG